MSHQLVRLMQLSLLTFLILLVGSSVALAEPPCDTRTNNTHGKLLECVSAADAYQHLVAFQEIADANGGTRASGTPGYWASVQYIVDQLTPAGYEVTVQEFEFPFSADFTTFERISPNPYVYADQDEYDLMTFSGEGDVMAAVQAVDLSLANPSASTSGCEAADFAGFTAGRIALVQRGTCTFALKAQNAAAAGAVGVIVMNQGTPDRLGVLFGTLGGPGIAIPVLGTTFAVGEELAMMAATGEVVVRIAADVVSETRTAWNVLAETSSGNDDNVVMVGAHLDSVVAGPGINDNGSGNAALLEVALDMAKVKPRNTVRFAWWGAEEFGLLGSEYYVDNLSEEEIQDITLYLNFDMIGSPNFFRGIYDGDDSDGVGAGPGPEGSAQIEKVFERYYTERGLAFEGTDFSGRSDYGPFIAVGIPAGGLFTGAEGIKTPEQAAIYGGTAGEQYDPCYHRACDTLANVSMEVFDQNVDAVAYATLTYAMNTESINDVKGKGNFKPSPVPDHHHDEELVSQ